MLSEIFWSFFITSIIACLLTASRLLYKSKCENIECCGLIIKRNVSLEEKIDEIEINDRVESKENINRV
jgi:hypothetical protein